MRLAQSGDCPAGQGAVTYVPGVDDVYIIVNGPHRGELMCQRRVMEGHARYPFIRARADGWPIRVIAEEDLNGEPERLLDWRRICGASAARSW